MRTRCPYPSCAFSFEVPDELAFKPVVCPSCASGITVRSLERHVAVDAVANQHDLNNTLFNADKLQDQPKIVAVLEDIRSLWNVGSMFRTADGAGCGYLVLTGITGYPPRKEIEKTSLGAESVISWSYAANTVHVLPVLKQLGYTILSLEKDERSIRLSKSIQSRELQTPLCIVVGNEVTGLYRETLAMSDRICHLDMRGMKTSLNVAVAFGIALYMLTERNLLDNDMVCKQ